MSPRFNGVLKIKSLINIDIDKYFSSSTISHTIIIENKWFEKMKETTLYLYEFNTEDFILQDGIAGYYISKKTQIPIAKYEVKDLFMELFNRNVEVRMVDSLWYIADKIKTTSLHWSICRMAFAQPMVINAQQYIDSAHHDIHQF